MEQPLLNCARILCLCLVKIHKFNLQKCLNYFQDYRKKLRLDVQERLTTDEVNKFSASSINTENTLWHFAGALLLVKTVKESI